MAKYGIAKMFRGTLLYAMLAAAGWLCSLSVIWLWRPHTALPIVRTQDSPPVLETHRGLRLDTNLLNLENAGEILDVCNQYDFRFYKNECAKAKQITESPEYQVAEHSRAVYEQLLASEYRVVLKDHTVCSGGGGGSGGISKWLHHFGPDRVCIIEQVPEIISPPNNTLPAPIKIIFPDAVVQAFKTGNAVDDYLSKLPTGKAVVTAPKQAVAYEPFSIEAHLSAAEMPKYSLKETEVKGLSRTVLSDVKIATRMKATLVGEDIKLVDGQSATIEQAGTETGVTSWAWRVYSESSGAKTATVKLTVILKVDGADTVKDFDVAEAKVLVRVNAIGWAQHHWEWVASSLIIPLAGWLVPKVLPNKRDPTAPEQTSRKFAALLKRRRVGKLGS